MGIFTSNTVYDKYRKLVQSIVQISHKYAITYNEQNTLIIEVRNLNNEIEIIVKLFQPLDNPKAYNHDYLSVSWRMPPHTGYMACHTFHQTTDQQAILSILLHDISNWKLLAMEDKLSRAINTALSSEALDNWLKAREEKLQSQQEGIKKELKELVYDELKKIKLGIKIGD